VEGTRLDRRPQGFILGCILHSYGDIGNARPGSESAEVGVRPTRFGRCVGAPSRERGWYHRRTKRGESRGILLPRRTLEPLTAWHECTPKAFAIGLGFLRAQDGRSGASAHTLGLFQHGPATGRQRDRGAETDSAFIQAYIQHSFQRGSPGQRAAGTDRPTTGVHRHEEQEREQSIPRASYRQSTMSNPDERSS